jgi:hypothetical protein
MWVDRPEPVRRGRSDTWIRIRSPSPFMIRNKPNHNSNDLPAQPLGVRTTHAQRTGSDGVSPSRNRRTRTERGEWRGGWPPAILWDPAGVGCGAGGGAAGVSRPTGPAVLPARPSGPGRTDHDLCRPNGPTIPLAARAVRGTVGPLGRTGWLWQPPGPSTLAGRTAGPLGRTDGPCGNRDPLPWSAGLLVESLGLWPRKKLKSGYHSWR